MGLALGTATPAAAATTHHVTMTGFPTNPSFCVEVDCSNHTLTLAAGDTVVWYYSDGYCDATQGACPGHTATSTSGPGSFSSPTMYGQRVLSSGPTTYSVTFGAAGTYNYTCGIHGSGPSAGVYHMDGALVVRGPAGQTVQGSRPIVAAGPGGPGGPGSANGFFSNGTSDTVSSDLLPNTFVPGLPNSGGSSSHPHAAGAYRLPRWVLPPLALAMAVATLAAVLGVRKLHRGR
jgi:plastocyanin